MKIRDISVSGHPFFGELTFDALLPDGTPASTIVIAGENGTGKTKFLELLYDFSRLQPTATGSGYCQLTFDFDVEQLQALQAEPTLSSILTEATNTWRIKVDHSLPATQGITIFCQDESGWKQLDAALLLADPVFRASVKALYSTVEINYIPTASTFITNNSMEDTARESIRSGQDLATKIQQLLIDMQSRDANDLNDWTLAHPGQVPPASVQGQRIKQFQNAFSVMFGDELNYYGVKSAGERKQVLFRKRGQLVDLADLSSGEKQIVFRGAFLLQNRSSMCGNTILIDEPELSLHPLWRTGILHYYQSLFSDGTTIRGQLFVTTHSPRVVESCFHQPQSLLWILRQENGKISVHKIGTTRALPSVTIAETNYLAFGLASIDYHVGLYSYLQSLLHSPSIIKLDHFIRHHAAFNPSRHELTDQFADATYFTLPTYIRNAINHPESGREFTPTQLRVSIDLLRQICQSENNKCKG